MNFNLPPGATHLNVYQSKGGDHLKLTHVLKAVGDPGGLAADAEQQALNAKGSDAGVSNGQDGGAHTLKPSYMQAAFAQKAVRAVGQSTIHQFRPAETPEDLQARAERLYPRNAYLQAEWIRAVGVVRSTKGGWHLDRRVTRPQ